MSDISEAHSDKPPAASPAAPDLGTAGDRGHSGESVCLNCGTRLIGRHCHSCGQAAHVHRTLGAFFHDLLHGAFHFEGKLWRSLPLLVWRPGKLTREYIDGRRASYVSPVALFLFAVFLTFAVFNMTNGTRPMVMANAADVERGAQADLAKVEAQLAEARSAGNPTVALEESVTGQREALEGIRSVRRGELPKAIASADKPGEAAWADRVNAVWRHARENPELIVYKLQSSAYKYSWLLIPLSVPFVWVLFPFNRRFRLYDHTIFVTYSLSFMLLLLGLASLAVSSQRLGGALVVALLAYAPFHMYRQLRETYDLSGFGAWWRTWLLSSFAFVALALFAGAILVLALG